MTGYIVEEIGGRIRAIRKEKRLKLHELADKAGVSKGLLSKVENSKTVPSLPVLLEIINSLEVRVEDFFKGVGNGSFFLQKKASDKDQTSLPIVEGDANVLMNHNFLGFGFRSMKLDMKNKASVLLEETNCYQYIYVMSGKLECTLQHDIVYLDEGDSFLLNSASTCKLKNLNKTESLLFIIKFSVNGEE